MSPELATRTAFLRAHEMEQQGNYPRARCPGQQVQGPGSPGPVAQPEHGSAAPACPGLRPTPLFLSSPSRPLGLPAPHVSPQAASSPLLSISFFTLHAQRGKRGLVVKKNPSYIIYKVSHMNRTEIHHKEGLSFFLIEIETYHFYTLSETRIFPKIGTGYGDLAWLPGVGQRLGPYKAPRDAHMLGLHPLASPSHSYCPTPHIPAAPST